MNETYINQNLERKNNLNPKIQSLNVNKSNKESLNKTRAEKRNKELMF